jgi:hypothetical protein
MLKNASPPGSAVEVELELELGRKAGSKYATV